MHGAPRDASASRSDAVRTTQRLGFPPARRLRKARDFEALAKGRPAFRAGRRWLSLTARIERNDGGPDVRIGFTVARRFARASVHRSLVKRVLREAARHAWQPLAAVGRGRLDVMLRLRADFPTAQQCSLPAFRRQLRAEADQLLDALVRQLATESTA